MEAIRYFLWPAAFLLALVFVGATETANEKSMAMTLYNEEPGVPGAQSANPGAPQSVQTVSPKAMLRQPVSGNTADKKI